MIFSLNPDTRGLICLLSFCSVLYLVYRVGDQIRNKEKTRKRERDSEKGREREGELQEYLVEFVFSVLTSPTLEVISRKTKRTATSKIIQCIQKKVHTSRACIHNNNIHTHTHTQQCYAMLGRAAYERNVCLAVVHCIRCSGERTDTTRCNCRTQTHGTRRSRHPTGPTYTHIHIRQQTHRHRIHIQHTYACIRHTCII